MINDLNNISMAMGLMIGCWFILMGMSRCCFKVAKATTRLLQTW